MAEAPVGTEAIARDLESRIANAERYISNTTDPERVAGAQERLAEYRENLATVLGMDPNFSAGNTAQAVDLKPAETGNLAIDQANALSNILNNPLYTEEIKNAYLTEYLPGLTQANYEINKARATEVQNSFLRQQAQAQAIREVAGDYAARGMRTPKMVTEGFAPIQQSTELQKQAAEGGIKDLEANKDVLYGAGAQNAETFISNPIMFGAIGAGARRSALGALQGLPDIYGLTQVDGASSYPGRQGGGAGDNFRPPADTVSGTSGLTAAQLRAKIEAANKYLAKQQAQGNTATVSGAQNKIKTYEDDLRAVTGGF